jgi:predicted AAA+ superfamily ATPase
VIDRNLAGPLRDLAALYPVVTVTGPRQSGKTTLCRATFPDKAYVSLEPLDQREFAKVDPRGFLQTYAGGAIVDEVQHAPELLSYLQAEVDERPESGRFVLTGSQHFGLTAAVSQSLAGRTAVLHLLPLSLDEVRRFASPPSGLFETLYSGGYPRIFDQRIPPARWLADYITTYVERDVRDVLNVTDLQAFATFLRLCAGRTSQEVNLSAIGADAGISHNTARAWLSVLETSFICFRVPAWHVNVGKRLRKAAKLHFVDSGLACHLLGIRTADQLVSHPLRGAVFESWVAAEVYKARVHRALPPAMSHLREDRGGEIDLLVEDDGELRLVESKSGATIVGDTVSTLVGLAERVGRSSGPAAVRPRLVYGGQESRVQSGVEVVSWSDIQTRRW